MAVGAKVFRFPSAVVTGSDQGTAFDAIGGELVDRLLEGYSCSLLAYGQASCKTKGGGVAVMWLCLRLAALVE